MEGIITKFHGENCKTLDVDVSRGVVKARLSCFDNVDLDGDVIVKGAYTKTLQENKGNIWICRHHNLNEPLSKPTELYQSNEGLDTVFHLDSKSPNEHVRNTLEFYEKGYYNQHSVGFRSIKESRNKDGINVITEIKLHEGSPVLWGANPLTPTLLVGTSQKERSEYLSYLDLLKAERDLLQIVQKSWSGTETAWHGMKVKSALLNSYIVDVENYLSGTLDDNDASKNQEIEKSTRERIELKGVSWEQLQALPEDAKKAISFIGEVRYGVGSILRGCGEARADANTEIYAEEIFRLSKPVKAYLEVAENQILQNTEIFKQQNSNKETKNITDPNNISQPNTPAPEEANKINWETVFKTIK